ncbi:MAG: hypothetical protein ACHQVS_04330, partial [Candidatus Babeliales bacterium]
MNKLSIVLSLVLCNVPISAFVYRMGLWEDDKHNIIITLSDWHSDTLSFSTTLRQKREIIELAKKLNAYGIFEDAGWYTGKNPEILKAIKWTQNLEYYGLKVTSLTPAWIENRMPLQQGSALFDITNSAKQYGVDCESIEFRQASRWAHDGYKISLRDIYQELAFKAQEIEEYQDGDHMKDIYNFILKFYSTHYPN